ncbi:hypothetical protein HMI54_000246 [Coelomomyces lativittatus]|nr:hypothetical protein HMI54_000246 [Coelomomyces lativittatus]
MSLVSHLDTELNRLLRLCEDLQTALAPWKTYQPQFMSLEKKPSTSTLSGLDGLPSLEKAIQNEYNYLKKNVWHWAAIVSTLYTASDVVAVLKPISYSPTTSSCLVPTKVKKQKCTIDVIAKGGLQWIKVRTSNPKRLMHEFLECKDMELEENVFMMSEEEEDKDEDEATAEHGFPKWWQQWPNLALHHPVHFQIPQCHVYLFHTTPPPTLLEFWKRHGWQVQSNPGLWRESPVHVLPKSSLPSLLPFPFSSPFLSTSWHPPWTSTIVLDTSTLIAWVSEVTHTQLVGPRAGFHLQQQALKELRLPVLPLLASVFHQRTLVVSQFSYEKCVSIIDTIAGEQERTRFYQLPIHAVYLTPWIKSSTATTASTTTNSTSSPSSSSLLWTSLPQRFHSSVTFHSMVLGDLLHATVVTANLAFVRALLQLGIQFPVWVHPPRSLSEQASLNGKYRVYSKALERT